MNKYELKQTELIKKLIKDKSTDELIEMAFDLNEGFKITRDTRMTETGEKFSFYGYECSINHGWQASSIIYKTLRECLIEFISASKNEKETKHEKETKVKK